jgi:hypothetical protein
MRPLPPQIASTSCKQANCRHNLPVLNGRAAALTLGQAGFLASEPTGGPPADGPFPNPRGARLPAALPILPKHDLAVKHRDSQCTPGRSSYALQALD